MYRSEAASRLEFERAAHLRDQIQALKHDAPPPSAPAPVSYAKGKGKGQTELPLISFAPESGEATVRISVVTGVDRVLATRRRRY